MKKNAITVVAKAIYLADQSAPEKLRFLWSYEITVTNQMDEIVQLLNRFWRITDLTGHIEEVRGPGVVGLQPIIKPGKPFVYTSFCQISTPQGTMEGHYEMQTLDEKRFIIPIPKFVLSSPVATSTVYRTMLH